MYHSMNRNRNKNINLTDQSTNISKNNLQLNNPKKVSLIDSLDNVNLDDYFADFDNNTPIAEVNKAGCQNCASEELVEDFAQGILVCTSCGQVVDNIIDRNPEWRNYDDDGKTEGRCNLPTNKLLPQSSLGTTISGFGRSRLRTLHNWSKMPYRERSLNEVFKQIARICEKAKIMRCIEDDAKIMYKTISECTHIKGKNNGKHIITRGKNRTGIIAACLFYACKRKDMTRSSREIADLFNLTSSEMNKGCKNFVKLLNIRKFNMNMGTCHADHFVKRYCNELGMKTEYINQSIKIAKNIDRLNVATEHTPISIAAACILIMADINGIASITKKKLGNKFGLSEVTIGKTYKKIENLRPIINDDIAIDKIVENIKNETVQNTLPPAVLARMKKFGISADESNVEALPPKPKSEIVLDPDDDIYDLDLDDDYDTMSLQEIIEEMKGCKMSDIDRLEELSECFEQKIMMPDADEIDFIRSY